MKSYIVFTAFAINHTIYGKRFNTKFGSYSIEKTDTRSFEIKNKQRNK